jgi:hypothetical protein
MYDSLKSALLSVRNGQVCLDALLHKGDQRKQLCEVFDSEEKAIAWYKSEYLNFHGVPLTAQPRDNLPEESVYAHMLWYRFDNTPDHLWKHFYDLPCKGLSIQQDPTIVEFTYPQSNWVQPNSFFGIVKGVGFYPGKYLVKRTDWKPGIRFRAELDRPAGLRGATDGIGYAEYFLPITHNDQLKPKEESEPAPIPPVKPAKPIPPLLRRSHG